MQSWTREYGTVVKVGGEVKVTGTHDEMYGWAHRPGMAWPCSGLACYGRVSATLDMNGDLIELAVMDENGRDVEGMDISGDELTAWIDDNLHGTPLAHLARTPMGGM